MSIQCKASFLCYSKFCQRCILSGQYFYKYQVFVSINILNIRKEHQSSYTNGCFTLNGPLKILLLHFWYFHFSSINMAFSKHFMKNTTFFKMDFHGSFDVLMSHKMFDWAILDGKIMALGMFCKTSSKSHFLCLAVYVNSRNMIYLIS